MSARNKFASLLIAAIGSFSTLPAQSPWAFTPTSGSGTMLGTVTANGSAASQEDWLGAFDEQGNCAGAAQLIINDGQTFFSLPIYADDATTPYADEGMGGGEDFTLRLWRASTGQSLDYPNADNIAWLDNWASTNGAPMPGLDDAFAIYDFAYEAATVTALCSPTDFCISGDAHVMIGSPSGGSWTGPGMEANGWFEPVNAGLGAHELAYTWGKQIATCTVHVMAPVAITLTPDAFTLCTSDPPYLLMADPSGGNWIGNAVEGSFFIPAYANPGAHQLTYLLGDACESSIDAFITVVLSPQAPEAVSVDGGLLVVSDNNGLPYDSIQWHDTNGPIDGANSVSFATATPNVPYFVEVFNTTGCSAISA